MLTENVKKEKEKYHPATYTPFNILFPVFCASFDTVKVLLYRPAVVITIINIILQNRGVARTWTVEPKCLGSNSHPPVPDR